jgi:hypothetical protein
MDPVVAVRSAAEARQHGSAAGRAELNPRGWWVVVGIKRRLEMRTRVRLASATVKDGGGGGKASYYASLAAIPENGIEANQRWQMALRFISHHP